MKIFPAIDLLDGKAVRLVKGDYGTARTYSDSPVDQAKAFRAAGAKRLHVVDLDGARSGLERNGELIREIVKSSGMFVQVGGGIRDEGRIEYYLSAGAGRVILGTAAVRDPDFLRRALRAYGDRVAVGVDVLDGYVAVEGWTELSDKSGGAFVAHLADIGVKTVIYTEISRDGMLAGADLEAYRRLSGINIDIIASGGLSGLDEIAELKDMGIYGAIAGRALYEGKLDLSACIAAAEA